uniref:Putative microtubule binding protein n=1 Tax=Lutzomyia longipalpis TaxID=7200 RepID=A0A7G3AQV3_LUTLO
MAEIKSVKVDNWGVFFLQKLQNFFNKTDYCDLTLQFKDNSQLKVHRLVLSACTDYFNLLETTCEMHGDILIMPRDLQADVVVPIVNFMYTGTLEFEVCMYERLLKTARDMNMTVLLKLLEAHRRSIPTRMAPVILNKSAQQQPQQRIVQRTPNVRPVERTYASAGRVAHIGGVTIKKEPGVSYIRKPDLVPEPVALVSKYPHVGSKTGPSRFEPPDENITEAFDSSFNPISYESKPLITAEQMNREEDDGDDNKTSAMFEKLRKSGYTNPNKRPAITSSSPPSKKLNLQDVKEYTEAAKMRKQLEAEEAEDEPRDYDDVDDTYSNSSDDQPGGRVVVKTKKDTRPTVVVQESGKVNHAKIISEVLKKYPHLVKNNKNIKLKIMQKSPQGTTREVEPVEVKAKPTFRTTTTPSRPAVDPKNLARGGRIDSKTMHALIAKGAENMEGPWLCLRCGVDGRPIGIPTYKGFRRHLVNVHNEKIDPRICEHCGWKARTSRKAELFYHILVKHKIKPPADVSFPKCKDCAFIAPDEMTLSKHSVDVHGKKRIQHQTCIYCNKSFASETALYKHMHNQHKTRAKQDGILDESEGEEDVQVGEQYVDEMDKYVPNVESELTESSDQKIKILSNISLPSTKSIPFVLDPAAQHVNQIQGKSATKLEPSSEAEALSNVASGIATSLGLVEGSVVIGETQYQGDADLISSQYIEAAMADVHGEEYGDKKGDQEIMTKLVTEDGSELELTAAQKEELMSQLRGSNDNVVMVLNQDNFVEGNTQIINSADQKIVVVYSQADDGLKETYLHASDMKESVLTPNTPMEWQESSTQDTEDNSQGNITSQDEDETKKSEEAAEEETSEVKKPREEDGKAEESSKKSKSDEDKLKLISELEGDWSEDEEMGMEAAKVEVTKPEDITAMLRTTANASDDDGHMKGGSAVEEVEQNLSALLEDWNNDSQTSAKETTTEEPCGKKDETDKGAAAEAAVEAEVKEEKPEEEEEEEQEKDKKSPKSEENKKSSEIKTLINDWGDDDEDL